VKSIDSRLIHENSTNFGQLGQSSEEAGKLLFTKHSSSTSSSAPLSIAYRTVKMRLRRVAGWHFYRKGSGVGSRSGEAKGKVFTDLTDTEWAILDAFEDSAYTHAAVRVMLPVEAEAFAYIWDGKHVDQAWSIAGFGRDELADYLDRCRRWRRLYEQRSS